MKAENAVRPNNIINYTPQETMKGSETISPVIYNLVCMFEIILYYASQTRI